MNYIVKQSDNVECKRPILSICIPTYNRAGNLKKSLDIYLSLPSFDEEVEIVISDNSSTDNTQRIGQEYSTRYSNIKYFRNKENIHDGNFPLALSRASGHYIKLMNDNLSMSEDGLRYIKEKIKKFSDSRQALFFTNGHYFNHKKADEIICKKFEDFIVYLSYYVKAIYNFGCWREDWEIVHNPTKYSALQLSQDDWCYQIMEAKERCILCTRYYCSTQPIAKGIRTGYNWFQVHIVNYYTIMQPYVDKGLISKKAIAEERKTYLWGLKTQFVMKYLYNVMPEWQFDTTGATKVLWKYFKTEPRYYIMMSTIPLWGGYMVLKHFLRNLGLIRKG